MLCIIALKSKKLSSSPEKDALRSIIQRRHLNMLAHQYDSIVVAFACSFAHLGFLENVENFSYCAWWSAEERSKRVASSSRKLKVLPLLPLLLLQASQQMSFHMHIAGTSVMWSIFKRYMFYLPTYFKHTLLLHINIRVAAISFKLSNTYSAPLFQRAFQLLLPLLLGRFYYASWLNLNALFY